MMQFDKKSVGLPVNSFYTVRHVEIGNLIQSCLRLQQFLHFRIMYAELFVITGLLLCLH